MSEANNGQHPLTAENATLPAPAQRKPKRHNAKLCPLAIRERIVNALAAGDSHRAIARALRVSPNTVTAVAEQEWKRVDARKVRIAAQCERNATLAAERINAKLESKDDIPLPVLVPVFGVSVDKLALLRGDASLVIRQEHLHRVTTDDLIAFAAQRALLKQQEERALNAKVAKATVVETPQLPEEREIRLQAKKTQRKKS